jgi:hypothetical protein
VVLVDDDGVRAVMTAHWMKQMGWDAAALTLDMGTEGSATGAWTPRVPGLEGRDIPLIDAVRCETGSPPGVSAWSMSTGAATIARGTSPVRGTGSGPTRRDSPETAAVGCRDLHLGEWRSRAARCRRLDRRLIDPGVCAGRWNGGLRAAGFPLEPGATRMACDPDDVRLRAREQTENIEEAMRAYLDWEINLAARMAADDDQRFSIEK